MKIIRQNKEARDSLIKGVNLVADVVKSTLGPMGQNVAFTDRFGMPRITNDGISIAKEVQADDVIEQMGIDIIKQSSYRTNLLAGDGTTTSIVLAQAIVKEGLKSDKNPMQLRREINESCVFVTNELKKMAKPIKNFEEIKKIATISVENEEIGHLIATASEKVGKDGQVTVMESEISGVRLEYINGLEISEGYIHPMMMNNEKAEAVITNPHILIIDSKLSNIMDIKPVLDLLAQAGFLQLVVICDGMDGNMIPTIFQTKKDGKFEIVGVKLPAVNKQEYLEDIALVTNGKIFGMSTGLFPNKAKLEDLGTCERIVIKEKSTLFIGVKGNVDDKVKSLKAIKDEREINKDQCDARIARLKGQVAIIKVGAPTDSELGYLKMKIDDAICATKAAMEEGVIKGGGIALLDISNKLPSDNVLKQAIQAPYDQIQTNAGGILVIKDIIDPVKVTRIALENACSVAGILITTNAAIATKKDEKGVPIMN